MEDADFKIRHDEIPYRFYSIAMGGSIWSTPILHKDMIVFGCNDAHIYALDKNGSKLWSLRTNDMVFSSPVVYKDLFIVGSNDGNIYAISAEGEVKWKFYTGDRVSASPLVVAGVVYIGSNSGSFYALSADDGKELWKYLFTEGLFIMSASAVNDSIFFGHSNGSVVSLSEEGRLMWKVETGDMTASSPVLLSSNNDLLCDFWNRSLEKMPKSRNCQLFIPSTFFRCIDTEDGSVKRKVQCNTVGSSNPFYSHGNLYFGAFDGNIYSVDVKGKLNWKFLTSNRIASSPVVHDKNIYFGSSDHNVYSIGLDGKLNWRFCTDGEVISIPVIDKNVLYIGSWDSNLYALDVITKEVLWKFRTSMTPSFIMNPKTVSLQEEPLKHKFSGTKTIVGNEVEKQYSVQSGELTNTFYGTPASYKKKRSAYDFDATDNYR